MSLVGAATLAGREPCVARAASAQEVLEAARELDATSRKWTDRTQTLHLTTRKGGETRERVLTVYDQRTPEENRSATFLTAPAKLKGTAFLQRSPIGNESQQWLYLPELRRARRVGSGNRDQSFMGSVLTYRDLDVIANLQDWSEEQAPRRLVEEQVVDGVTCHLIEFEPAESDVPYRRIQLWMERDRLIPRRLRFFDGSGDPVKTITLGDIRDVSGKPTAHRIEVERAKEDAHTKMVVSEVRYDVDLPEDLFTTRSLSRGGP